MFCERVKNNYKQRNKMGRRRPPEPRCTLMIDFRDTQSLLLREEISNFSYIYPRLKTHKRFLAGVLEHLNRWRPDFPHTTIFVACEAPRPLRDFVIIFLLQSSVFSSPSKLESLRQRLQSKGIQGELQGGINHNCHTFTYDCHMVGLQITTLSKFLRTAHTVLHHLSISASLFLRQLLSQ